MRARSTILAVACLAAGCSRPTAEAAPVPAPPPPVAREDRRADVDPRGSSLMFATAIEELDAGATARSLAGKTVLLVGDSMVGNHGLLRALDDKLTAEGAKLVHEHKVSESVVSFDKSPKLARLLSKHDPDVVVVALGTNDVFVPYPQTMAANVRRIVARIGARECYWMGPPTWKPDTGIVAVIRDNAGPCRFFDASTLRLPRAGDGIHPTDKGGAIWAERFWDFLRAAEAER